MKATVAGKHVETPEEKADTHSRLVALFLVFAVVIFFWMAFHQNGLTLTYFARDFTQTTATGLVAMLFDVTNLLGVIVLVYALFALFQSKTTKGKTIAGLVIIACAVFLGYKYGDAMEETINVDVPLFQQFNPCFVVMLTPVSMALFGWLASKGKEPSAPRKIGFGMLVAGIGYVIMMIASIGLSYHLSGYPADDPQRVSPLWLVSTYLVLTFAELLLSPMGISFVSKVAPQKYQGLMMGCWFGATAIGNFLVQIPAYLWNHVPLTGVWAVFVVLCLASFIFIFSVMKKLEKVSSCQHKRKSPARYSRWAFFICDCLRELILVFCSILDASFAKCLPTLAACAAFATVFFSPLITAPCLAVVNTKRFAVSCNVGFGDIGVGRQNLNVSKGAGLGG